MWSTVILVLEGGRTDLELVQLSKKGDRRAFGELVKRYQRRVYALCYRLAGSHDAADDLTQEAFIKAFLAIDSFDESYPFLGWIGRIATNNALNYLKRQKFQLGGEEAEAVLAQQHDTRTSANPEQKLGEKEMEERFQRALAKLSPEFRVVFVLRMQEDLSYEQIAERLGITLGTVMSRLHRARARLVEELKDLFE